MKSEYLFFDYYSHNDLLNNIDDLYNYYEQLYNTYKKEKDIYMYLLKYNNKINGIFIYKKNNTICEILCIELNIKNDEFIYFIGDYLLQKYSKFIFYNINQKNLLYLYKLILKFEPLEIYSFDNILINNFDNMKKENIYIFNKIIKSLRREKYCNCII